MSEKAVQTSLSFFKIFDLAFFAPGLLIAIHLGILNFAELKSLSFDLSSTAGTIIAVIAGIGIVYALGLANFALSRVFLHLFLNRIPSLRRGLQQGWRPFPMRFEGSTRDDLLLYFWYLRSTTLALGVAFLVSAVYLKINTGFTSCWGMTLGELLCAGFLFFLSRDYKENLDRSFDSM